MVEEVQCIGDSADESGDDSDSGSLPEMEVAPGVKFDLEDLIEDDMPYDSSCGSKSDTVEIGAVNLFFGCG